MDIGFILLDLLITSFGYLALPIFFCIKKKKFTKEKIKKITIINSVCVCLLFIIIRIALGGEGASGAVFIWSIVGYKIMMNYILRNDEEECCEPKTEENDISDNEAIQYNGKNKEKKTSKYNIKNLFTTLLNKIKNIKLLKKNKGEIVETETIETENSFEHFEQQNDDYNENSVKKIKNKKTIAIILFVIQFLAILGNLQQEDNIFESLSDNFIGGIFELIGFFIFAIMGIILLIFYFKEKNDYKKYSNSKDIVSNVINVKKEPKLRVKKTIDKKRIIKFLKITAVILPSIIILCLIIFLYIIPSYKYNAAIKHLEYKNYDEAEYIFRDLDDFKDSKSQLKYIDIRILCDENKYEEAINKFKSLNGDVKIIYDCNGGELNQVTDNELINSFKEGYVFVDYSITDYKIKTNKNPILNISLKANYKEIDYEIQYVLNGGTNVNNPSGYSINDELILNYPQKEGHSFIGWSLGDSSNIEKDLVIKKGTIGDLTLVAHFSPNNYTINFDLNYESVNNLTSINVVFGEKYKLHVPEQNNYIFSGWYYDGKKMDNEGVYDISEDITLIAIWKPLKYTITFNTDGGSTIDPITEEYQTIIFSPVDPKKEGYTFIGWSENIPSKMPGYDMVITAKWQKNIYTISFETNSTYSVPQIQQIYDDQLPSLKEPVKMGYTFNGWYYNGILIKSGDIYQFASDVTFTAKWIPNEYTISFDTNGGNVIPSVKEKYDLEISSLGIPIKEGYTFTGWFYEGKEIKEGATFIYAHDIQLIAQWEANQYQISFDTNGGNNISSIIHQYNEKLPVFETPQKEGYTFKYWTYNGEVFAGNTIFNICSDIILVAEWKINQYTITFISDGDNKLAPLVFNYGEKINITTYPFKNNYWFIGWDKKVEYMPASDLVLTAQWSSDYQFTNNINGTCQIDKYKGKESIVYLPYNYTFRGEVLTVVGVSDGAFFFNNTIKELHFSSTIGQIDYQAFSGCGNLTTVYMEKSSVDTIGEQAFAGCSNLKTVILPDSLKSIERFAFRGCAKLENLMFPKTLKSIGEYAFEECSSLKTVIIPKNVTTIERRVFYACGALKIYCEADKKPSGWSDSWKEWDQNVVWNYSIN